MQRPGPSRFAWGLAFCVALTTAPARSNTLLTNGPGEMGYWYSGSDWTDFTADLDSEFTAVDFVPNLSNAADFAGVDAVMFVIRTPGSVPTAAELTNVAAFMATGKRTLLVGENESWAAWDTAILNLLGGTYVGGWLSGDAHAVVFNELTAGAETVNLPAAGNGTGGTQLYDQTFAALWGPNQSILTVLDVNVFDDDFGNPVFQQNVAAWLADGQEPVIPEPCTLALLMCGGVAVLRRRR